MNRFYFFFLISFTALARDYRLIDSTNDYAHICHGSQISHSWIVTAKHCLQRNLLVTDSHQNLYGIKISVSHPNQDLALLKVNNLRTSPYYLSQLENWELEDSQFFSTIHENAVFKFLKNNEYKVLMKPFGFLVEKGNSGSALYTEVDGRKVLQALLLSTPNLDQQTHVTFLKLKASSIQWIGDVIDSY